MVTQLLQNFARQSIFDALAALFLRPEEPDTLPRLREAMQAAAGLATELGIDPTPFERLAEGTMPTTRNLTEEYVSLFGDTNALSLAESAWIPADPSGLPVTELQCSHLYQAAGLETAGLVGITTDHIALQFAFTTVLILKEDLKGAAHFFDQHLANWLPAFATAIRQREDARFYRQIADVLEGLCEIEKALR